MQLYNSFMFNHVMFIFSYILALKGELAEAHVSVASVAEHGTRSTSASSVNGQQMEQTILAMRRVVERLKVENKNLKDGKMLGSKSGATKVCILVFYTLSRF